MRSTITIQDRNCILYLVASGFSPASFGSCGDVVKASFEWLEQFDGARADYIANKSIPVQNFITACRFVGDAIKRLRGGGR